jgi:hypothetical protein
MDHVKTNLVRLTFVFALFLGCASVEVGEKAEQELNVPPAGFLALFNGTDLLGWQGVLKPYDNPIKRQELSPEEYANRQAQANERMGQHWKVNDGILEFDGAGFSLGTDRHYGDFEMLVDWKLITDHGDSGIYLRGSPQVQIWDPKKSKVGSGGLFNNKKHLSKPSVLADRPIGQWNTFRIKMVKNRVTVHLNDQIVVNNVVMENYWDRKQPILPEGPIELQCHGDPIHFRNIFIREIHRPQEFRALFNGTDLSGWKGDTKGYLAQDGMLLCQPGGNLYTVDEFDNFIFHFKFKLKPGANNGLGIRTGFPSHAAYEAMELQILDNTADKYKELHDYQYHGSIYGVVPAQRGHLQPVGEWNSQEVIAVGNHITVNLNGHTIVDADIKKESTPQTRDKKEHPGLLRPQGHFAFLGHGDVLEFKDIKVKTLQRP